MKVALIGNQNCGKTTLFNRLTGKRRHAGNFPGVTVDVAAGEIKGIKGVDIVDLPGVYSLTPYSSEEAVTRDFLLQEKPDSVINILDATNLNRNLYLTMQLLETQTPMVLALNMMDEVYANGTIIDVDRLSELLGVPVIPISAAKNKGIYELKQTVEEVTVKKSEKVFCDLCTGAIHTAIHSLAHLFEKNAKDINVPAKYAAIKYLENDSELIEKLKLSPSQKDIADHFVENVERDTGTDREAAVVDMRYDNIERILESVIKDAGVDVNRLRTDKIDRILTHKYFAIPIFIGIMGLVFYLTFGIVGSTISDAFSYVINLGSIGLENLLNGWGVSEWLVSLVIDGIYAGVGSILSFLPTIVILFLCLSIIEDTGYMARVAFVMDRLLRKIGLSGRSVVPMLIGFGCSVPAYMATRTMSSERDKKMTALTVPFMSCSAKIPIYAVFTMAFFTNYRALVMLGIYVLGILLGVLYAFILQHTAFKGESVPFLMELPPYRFPSPKTVLLYLWEKAKGFIIKAFTFILIASIIVWFLRSFNYRFDLVADPSDSMLAAVSRYIAPIFKPLGFGDWRATTAIITGITAKESVVSTLAILMNVPQADLANVLSTIFTPLQGFSFLVFCSLYMPCIAALATFKKEMKSARFAGAAMLIQTFIAYIASLVIYTLGMLFGG